MADLPIRDLENAAADAMEESARKRTVGIVAGSGSDKWRGFGTGTLLRWNGRAVVLTAAHVIENTDEDDLRFFLPREEPSGGVGRAELLALPGIPSRGLDSLKRLAVSGVDTNPDLDLAAVWLSDVEPSVPGPLFDLSDEDFDATDGLTSLVVGFPHDISRVLPGDSRVAFRQTDWSQVEPPVSGVSGFDPSVHFVTRYTFSQAAPDAHPRGLSGAGRWARRSSTPAVWHPNLDLLGVTVTYFPSLQMLKMVKRRWVNEFLRSKCTA